MLTVVVAAASFSAPLRPLGKLRLPSHISMQEAEPVRVMDMPGITSPLGFFDPLDYCGEASEGKIKFYRGTCVVTMMAL